MHEKVSWHKKSVVKLKKDVWEKGGLDEEKVFGNGIDRIS